MLCAEYRYILCTIWFSSNVEVSDQLDAGNVTNMQALSVSLGVNQCRKSMQGNRLELPQRRKKKRWGDDDKHLKNASLPTCISFSLFHR